MADCCQHVRFKQAFEKRVQAAELARFRPHEKSFSNGEEFLYRDRSHCNGGAPPSYIASFTKGLRHRNNGQLDDPNHYVLFIRAIDSGSEADIRRIPLGPARRSNGRLAWRSRVAIKGDVPVRAWESMSAGLAFDLEGPDAQSVSMPPAPKLTSIELQAEMAELYLMALARDIPFAEWDSPHYAEFFSFATFELSSLPWFCEQPAPTDPENERARRRGEVNEYNIFRGVTPGTNVGPYLSQFLIMGSSQLGACNEQDRLKGRIRYGALTIEQKIRIATPCRDYMTDFPTFLDVQDGADLRGLEMYEPGSRFITTPRDLATYVHYDGKDLYFPRTKFVTRFCGSLTRPCLL